MFAKEKLSLHHFPFRFLDERVPCYAWPIETTDSRSVNNKVSGTTVREKQIYYLNVVRGKKAVAVLLFSNYGNTCAWKSCPSRNAQRLATFPAEEKEIAENILG